MRMILIPALILTAAAFSAELVEFPGRLQNDELSGLIDEMQVVFQAEDYFLAFVPQGMIEGLREANILDSGGIAPEDYVLVHLTSAEGLDCLSELGNVVFHRDDIAVVRLSGPMPEVFVREGVFFVQPLRVMNVREAMENPFRLQVIQSVDDDIADIVASVSEDTILAFIQHLENYGTRYSSTDNYDTACNWVEDKFQSYGLVTEQQAFSMGGYDCQNVIAELPGSTDSTKIYIICGHLDSTSGSAPDIAPGADDNASGATAVLEAARLLTQYEFDFTIRFICFGGEEQGLWGSEYYAEQAFANGDDIQGVVNLDMLLYGPYGEDIMWVPYNDQSEGLALALDAICDTYVPALNVLVEYSPGTTYSDHASFWNVGYSAVLGIESEVYSNPYYHQTTDILANYLEYFPFGTNCIKGSIATVACLAQPCGGTGVSGGGVSDPGFIIGSIAPNPAAEVLTVNIMNGISGNVRIDLYDIVGHRVATGTYDAHEGQVVMDISGLPPGIYGLRVLSGEMTETSSIVIAR